METMCVGQLSIDKLMEQQLLPPVRFVDHPRSGVVYNFGRVCLSVCQTITFESLEVGSSYLHIRYISCKYGSSSYMKVMGLRLRY